MKRIHPEKTRETLGLAPDIGNATVLMVEDNPDHAQLAQVALEKYGFSYIEVAGNMAEAFTMMLARQYEVLLVDHCLPDGYGIDLLDWVDDSCTVVMMTAQGSEKVAAEAFKRGVLDYVVKDALFREVLPEIVEQAMARNMAMKRAYIDESFQNDGNGKSAVVYTQTVPSLKGYVHTDHLKTTFSKIRRHLSEIRACLGVIRYNPEEPVTDSQLDFLESALDNCELLQDLLTHLAISTEKKPGL